MEIRDILKHIMEEQNVSQAELAKKLDISRAALWDRLNTKKNKDMGILQTNEMLKNLGYSIVIIADDVKRPTGAIEI